MTELHTSDSPPTDSLIVSGKQYVTEEEYWEKYYHYPEVTYEWNNGYLEEVGGSNVATVFIYHWLLQLLTHYLETQAIAQIIGLAMGFRLVLPHRIEIRRPNLGVILNTNPIPLLPNEYSYKGTFDLCIEAISCLSQPDIERDTVDKKHSYAQAGVKEYYILDNEDRHTAFYYLNEQGVYSPIKPVAGDIIQSTILPGFQFRRADLFTLPNIEIMTEDPIYPFVIPAIRETKQAYFKEKQARIKEEQARIAAEALVQQKEQARVAAETQMQQLLEKLRASGIDPEKL